MARSSATAPIVTPGDLGNNATSFARHLRASNLTPDTIRTYLESTSRPPKGGRAKVSGRGGDRGPLLPRVGMVPPTPATRIVMRLSEEVGTHGARSPWLGPQTPVINTSSAGVATSMSTFIRKALHPHLDQDEVIEAHTRATDAIVALTDRRLIVATRNRVALSIPVDGVRRIQFDIEKSRPATLVIVPEHPAAEPQVLAIPAGEYQRAGKTLAILGERLALLGGS